MTNRFTSLTVALSLGTVWCGPAARAPATSVQATSGSEHSEAPRSFAVQTLSNETLASPAPSTASAPAASVPAQTEDPSNPRATIRAASEETPIEYAPLPRDSNVVFNVQDAEVSVALRALANITGDRIIVTTEASPLVRCATITIVSPRRLRPAQVEPLVRAAIRPSGLSIMRVRDLLIVDRAANAPPAHACITPASTTGETGPASPPPGAPSSSQIIAGIRSVSPIEHTITDAAFDGALENQTELFRNVRIVPHEANGRVDGIQLFGIRVGEFLSSLGFLNGDMLQSINRLEVSSPDRALEAYSRLRTERTLELQVIRGGAPVVLTLRRVP